MATGYAPVQGGELYYETAGEGFPVLMIHAGVADHSMWDDQFETFTKQHRVVRFDCRGFGRSRTESVKYSNAQDVNDLLDHLGIKRTVVMGLSRGGVIAIDFTLHSPQRVAALIAAAAGVSGLTISPDGSVRARLESEMFSRMEELWEKGEIDELNELEVSMWADGPGQAEGRAHEGVRQRVRKMNRATFERVDGEPTPTPLEPPAAQRLGEITVPTLVLVGDLDTTKTMAAADYLAKGVAGARKVIFNGAAHMLNMEQPELFNQIVLSFLSACRLEN